MPVGDDTFAYRRRLPHLSRRERTYYVTICTLQRQVLPGAARDIILRTLVAAHQRDCWLDSLTIMPDHAHMIVLPLEHISLPKLLGWMKGRSSFDVNRALNRAGGLWQTESFDRILRSDENLEKKRAYIFNNPVRAGLVENWRDYPWNWWHGGALNEADRNSHATP